MSVYLKEDFIPANVSIGSGLLDRKRAGYEGRGGASPWRELKDKMGR